ncbi:MAG: tetratricopeptide repeat protein [Crocinitomicaceae bacterium]
MFDEEDNEDHEGMSDARFNSELKRFEKMIADDAAIYFDAEILEQIIEHYIINNQLKKGLKAVSIGLEQHPTNSTFKLRKAQVMSTMGQLKESLLLLQELEKIEPYNPEVFITKASVFSQLRDHLKAIKYYQKAIEIATSFDLIEELEEIRFDLAMEYESIHKYDKAIEVLEEILKYSPDNEAAIYEIAYCYERTGDFDKCIEFYNRYIDNNPYSFTAWYNLGNIYFLKGNIEKAIWAYDYSIIINDEFTSAHFNLGNVYMQIEEFEKARDAYANCLNIDANDALTLSYLAEAYERLGDFDEALEHYNKSRELNPELAEAWLGTGIVLDMQGKTTEAISFLSQAVQLQPENANYHHVLAEALYKIERYVEAEETLERTMQLSPNYSEAILLLAKIKALFSLEEAADFLLSLENMQDLSQEVRIYLVTILWQVRQFTDALLLFKKEYLIDKDSAKTLFLYFPEAEQIPEFIQIIETHNG